MSNGLRRLQAPALGRASRPHLEPLVSVILPTYNRASFLPRALAGLAAQTLTRWELLVIDDASTDDTRAVIHACLSDPRVRYERLGRNVDMAAAINRGLDLATGDYVAYLPSDDHYFPEHLESLLGTLCWHPRAALAYSGMRYWQNHEVSGQREGEPLQLVQVMHRRTTERWLTREALVTDDLERMFWSRLRRYGPFAPTQAVTCEWVDHRAMRHKHIRETLGGGLNVYRARYGARHPLTFHSTVGNPIDEKGLYARFDGQPRGTMPTDRLRILLVGELAYNPERVLALEERGHQLFGLWTDAPYWFSTVGPLPFGHVVDLDRNNWRAQVRDIRPDVIYAQLNWQAVPFVHSVLAENPGVPFVWHLKEGPQHCIAEGTWPQLVDLQLRSDAQIYSTVEQRDWFATVLPATRGGRSLVIDGDLPKREWLGGPPPRRLSADTGGIHTVVAGRIMGIDPEFVGQLAHHDVHLHLYGNIFQSGSADWITAARRAAPRHVHLHDAVDQRGWRSELGRYDAGWLHVFKSANGGDLHRARWDDLNSPARVATLMAAGLPSIQRDNTGSIVATQSAVQRERTGLLFTDVDDLADQLHDVGLMESARVAVESVRHRYTFDAHADTLIEFLRETIASRRHASNGAHPLTLPLERSPNELVATPGATATP